MSHTIDQVSEQTQDARAGVRDVATTLADVHGQCRAFIAASGFSIFLFYLKLGRANPVEVLLTSLSSDDATWLQKEGSACLLDVESLTAHIGPWAFDNIDPTTADEAYQKLLQLGQHVGVENALVIPVHTPPHAQGYFVVAGGSIPPPSAERDALYGQAWVFASRLASDTKALLVAVRGDEIKPTLTDQQRTVLELLAQGMSVKAIAKSIGRHPRSIEEALKQINLRLGVTSREQALLRAVALGYLSIISAPTQTLFFDSGASEADA